MQQYQQSKSSEDKANAFNVAKKELEYECHEKDIAYFDFYVFKFVIEYCNEIENFSAIISLIDIMYATPFKKSDEKFQDFYYSLIKLSDVKGIGLRFLQNKEFFSKENFQTVCIQIKEVLSATDEVEESVVVSFEELISRGEELKSQRDFQGAENTYREAIDVSTTVKQQQKAFKEIYNLYKNTDHVKMLSIINEFFDKDVFENEFEKHYEKSQMLIFTNAPHEEIYDSLTLLASNINSFDRKPWRWNEPVTLCMELIKIYIQGLLQVQSYDKAHSMCKFALTLTVEVKRSDTTVENYIKFFSNTQTKCGKVKRDLGKKGTAKISESTMQIETNKSKIDEISNDPDNLPVFKFNPSGLLQCIEISTMEDYEQYLSDYNSTTKRLNHEAISKKVSKLISNVEMGKYIKSLYIVEGNFVGTPSQARRDMDFYLHSKIRTAFDKKRDEYLSLAKIVSSVLKNYGECEEFNITQNTLKEYIMYAMLYHSKCVTSEDSKRYYLNIAKLIKAELTHIITDVSESESIQFYNIKENIV
jgi:hypothetical protein